MDQALEIESLRDKLRQSEEARHNAESRYRALFEGSMAGVFRCTLEGRVLDLNDSCAHMFDYPTPEQARGHNLREAFSSPSDFEHLMGLLRERRAVSNLQMELRRQDGQRLCVVVGASLVENGHDTAIEGTLIDATEWKQAEEALLRSGERFRALVEKST
ncbi:MAG: PAS domain-containing protein, partial [Terriglobia bacterium]